MREALAYNIFQDEENSVEMRVAELAAQLEGLLERLNPDKVTPSWINKNAPGLYVHLLEALPKENELCDWSPIVSRLDEKWRKRWSSQKRVSRERGLQDEVDSLTALLEAERPETFGPGWIGSHDTALSWRLLKKIRDKDRKLDWDNVIALLDEKWRARWTRKKSIEKGRTLEDEVAELTDLLQTEKPEIFNPDWIRARDEKMFFRLASRIVDENGKRDWGRMLASIGEEWRARWVLRKGEKSLDLQTEVRGLGALLEKEKPEVVTPSWIRQTSVGLYNRLLKVLRDEQGGHDWSRVTALLDDKWRERWSHETRAGRERSLEDDARDLCTILEAENPPIITPAWIRSRQPTIFFRLFGRLKEAQKSPKDSLDWEPLVTLLDDKWRERWSTREQSLERNLVLDVNNLEKLLEEKQPDSFSPKWIEVNDQSLYERLSYKIRTSKGQISWKRILSMLDRGWAGKWDSQASEKSLMSDIGSLAKILEEKKPRSLSPRWIERNDQRLYRRLSQRIRSSKGHLDWMSIFSLLDRKWADSWAPWSARQQTSEKALLRDIESLTKILEEKKPDLFSPKWIERSDRLLYGRLANRLRSSKERRDWMNIVSMLDRKWVNKWSLGASETDRHIPKNQYEDEEEIVRVFETHKEKLYTLISLLKPEDKQERDMICQELVALAQKGNSLAEEKLMDILKPLVQEWMDEFEDFSVYKNDPERVHRVLKRCIYLTKKDMKTPFIHYLYSSLRMGARGLRHQIARSFDHPLGDDDARNLHDFISSAT